MPTYGDRYQQYKVYGNRYRLLISRSLKILSTIQHIVLMEEESSEQAEFSTKLEEECTCEKSCSFSGAFIATTSFSAKNEAQKLGWVVECFLH